MYVLYIQYRLADASLFLYIYISFFRLIFRQTSLFNSSTRYIHLVFAENNISAYSHQLRNIPWSIKQQQMVTPRRPHKPGYCPDLEEPLRGYGREANGNNDNNTKLRGLGVHITDARIYILRDRYMPTYIRARFECSLWCLRESDFRGTRPSAVCRRTWFIQGGISLVVYGYYKVNWLMMSILTAGSSLSLHARNTTKQPLKPPRVYYLLLFAIISVDQRRVRIIKFFRYFVGLIKSKHTREASCNYRVIYNDWVISTGAKQNSRCFVARDGMYIYLSQERASTTNLCEAREREALIELLKFTAILCARLWVTPSKRSLDDPFSIQISRISNSIMLNAFNPFFLPEIQTI